LTPVPSSTPAALALTQGFASQSYAAAEVWRDAADLLASGHRDASLKETVRAAVANPEALPKLARLIYQPDKAAEVCRRLDALDARKAVVNVYDGRGVLVAIVHHTAVRGWCCRLTVNNAPASLFYAGFPHGEESDVIAALGRCQTVYEVRDCCRRYGQSPHTYELA
jgi:hypothetical protein